MLAQIELWQNHKKYPSRSMCCPSTWTRRSRPCISEKIGVKLTKLTQKQAEYLGVAPAGPFKPEHYRY